MSQAISKPVRNPLSTSSSSTALKKSRLKAGDSCYGLDKRGVWCPAEVLLVSKGRVKLRYLNPVSGQTPVQWKRVDPTQVRTIAPPDQVDDAASLDLPDTNGPDSALAKAGDDKSSAEGEEASPAILKKAEPGLLPVREQSVFEEDYPFLTQSSPSLAPQAPGSGPLSLYPSQEMDHYDSAILYESESPIASIPCAALVGGAAERPVNMPMTMITDIMESRLREYLKGLQLTRDFLRTTHQQPIFMLNKQNFFVRLNMGSRFFHYMAAQIVSISGDELQVRALRGG